MRYYPKRGYGIELSSFNTDALDDFETRLQDLRSSGEDKEADLLEDKGVDGPWHYEILAAINEWDGDAYDDSIFDAFDTWHNVVPMRIGEISDERGGETTGVSGFNQGTEYLIFDPREQDKDAWNKFKSILDENGIELIEGSWSQLG